MPTGPRPQPPVGTVRLAMSGVNGTLPWTIVFYLRLTDDGTKTAADLKSITDSTVNDFKTRMTTQLSASITQTDAKSVWITGAGTALEYEASYANGFTGGTELNNAATSIVANWAINQYYRGGHPRMYLPGVISANISNLNTLTAAYQATLAAALTNWMNDVNALTGTHVSLTELGTVSYARSNAWRGTPVFFPYKSVGIRNIIGTQRRRLGGR